MRADHLCGGVGRVWVFVLGLSIGCGAAAGGEVTFAVSVPGSTPDGGAVHVAGNFQGWDPGSAAHALTRGPDGAWSITLDLPEGAALRYKFTRGSWASVEKGPNGEEIADRTAVVTAGPVTLTHAVAGWADAPAGSVTGRLEVFGVPGFAGGRAVRVWLPEGYGATDARHPVLYMLDGQNLFDRATSFAGEWRADEAATALIAAGEIEPVIIVGVDNSPSRLSEYGPSLDGDAHLVEIRDGLMPEIARRYRVREDRAETMVGGSSLGGLMAAYAGVAHGETFGRVAALSPSYWYRSEHIIGFVEDLSAVEPAPVRFYHDMGTGEGAFHVGRVETMAGLLMGRGLDEGGTLETRIVPGGVHSESSWAARLPDILRYLVDPPCPHDLNSDGRGNIFDLIQFLEDAGRDRPLPPGTAALIGDLVGGCPG